LTFDHDGIIFPDNNKNKEPYLHGGVWDARYQSQALITNLNLKPRGQ
jgi:hypothetical protein